ncbi:MAG: hypothetical protein KME17_02490 [Cyanosarcina radialis HA8281-LM2]|jgi:hypothetical protein|nr:hypothetical protein [Cyanosarcina radialis HA8281-LM2]
MLSKQILFLATSAIVASAVGFLPSAALAGDFGLGTSPTVDANTDTTNQQTDTPSTDNTQDRSENTEVNAEDTDDVVTRGSRSRNRSNPGNTVRRPPGSTPVDQARGFRFRFF